MYTVKGPRVERRVSEERDFERGFSLVEALVVLVLLGVLVAAGLPAWQRNVAYKRLVMAQLVAVQEFRAAEQRARAERQAVCVRLSGGNPGRLETLRGGCGGGSVVQVTELPPGVAPRQLYEVEYDALGRASADTEVVLEDSLGRAKVVEVWRDGRVEAGP